MIVESAQLLSTTHHLANSRVPSDIYKITHKNHPSAIWARYSKDNYVWLFDLFCALIVEYRYRYGKIHKCAGMINTLAEIPDQLPDIGFTEPTPAMPEDLKVPGDSILSYRRYYIKNKQHLASWSGKINSRPVPEWFTL